MPKIERALPGQYQLTAIFHRGGNGALHCSSGVGAGAGTSSVPVVQARQMQALQARTQALQQMQIEALQGMLAQMQQLQMQADRSAEVKPQGKEADRRAEVKPEGHEADRRAEVKPDLAAAAASVVDAEQLEQPG